MGGRGEEEGELRDMEADDWQACIEGHVTHRMEPVSGREMGGRMDKGNKSFQLAAAKLFGIFKTDKKDSILS